MKNRKICLLIPSLRAGGMERVMSELADYFSSKEYLEIHLILYGKSRDIFYDLPEKVKIHTPEFSFGKYFRFLYTFRTLLFLRQKVKDIKPETVLSFGELWNSFVLLALYGTWFPVYISDRCSPEKKFSWFHTCLRKWLYPKAAGIIAQTQTAGAFLLKEFENAKIGVIGNPVRVPIIADGVQRQPVVLSIGRLIKTKHFDRLIRIFGKYSVDGWKLVIIGGNALNQDGYTELQNLIIKLQVEDKVVLTGERKDVDQYYGSSSIMAFTSSSEGFPNVIGEALSAGLPVIAYDCVSGPSEMIQDGDNGFLVPLFDDETFGQRLQILMSNSAIRQKMSDEARKVAEPFALKKIGQSYLDFILKNDETAAD